MALWPEHTVGDTAVIVGKVCTVTLTLAVPKQPAWVPVTTYVVVPVGVMVLLAPVTAGVVLLHAYVVAPLAVMVTGSFKQMAALLAVAFTVGIGLTVIKVVPLLVQPLASVPVT